MVWLCWFHHHRLHQAGYQLTLDPATNTVTVTRPDRTTVATLTADEPIEPVGLIDPDHTPAAPPPGEAGTRLDLDLIVGNLAWETTRPQTRRRRLTAPGRRVVDATGFEPATPTVSR